MGAGARLPRVAPDMADEAEVAEGGREWSGAGAWLDRPGAGAGGIKIGKREPRSREGDPFMIEP